MWTEEILFSLLSSVVKITLWIALMFLSFFFLEKVTNFSIKKEIVENENIAVWIMFAWFFIATWIIVWAWIFIK